MLKGNILDCYPDYKKDVMVTWITNKGKAYKINDLYQPSFYVYAKRDELITLATILRDRADVKKLDFTFKKIVLGSNKKKFVLCVTPKKLEFFRKLAEKIDYWGGFCKYQLFDVDIRMSSRYLQGRGVFCNGFVKWDGKKFVLNDEDQWAVDYSKPDYKSVVFEVIKEKEGRVISFKKPVKSIKIGDRLIHERSEMETILFAVKQLKHVDPDVLFVKKGDSLVFPYLYHRAKKNNIQKNLILGRSQKPLHFIKKSKSYFSYGHIIHRPAFYTLEGRAHLDTGNSFIYGESGLQGLVDMSRCSNIPIQILSRVGPGTAISQIQVNKARQKGYLVPWKKNIPEGWKTAIDLLNADRGGLILDPVMGLHENVVEFDFASLYPNIMVNYNVSPETMLCSCCKSSPKFVVPQLGYHICARKTGLIPEVLKPVLFRRFCYKARSKNKKYDTQLYKELQQAWKWVLLVCFGYTGYRNARYGRIECYESITAYSRDLLLQAFETVECAGYTVLHGIIDSLWVKAKKACVNPAQLSRMIGNKTGVRMDLEGHYKWIVFLPNKNTDVGALNRYYGLFDTGELKVRGVELRQKNSPVFLKNMQKEIIQVFSKADNKKEFLDLIPKALDVCKKYANKIIKREIDAEELVFKTCISKDITQYKVNTFAKCALLQLRQIGVEVEPGQSVSYIVCNEKSRNVYNRVCIVENLEEDKEYDIDFYLRQIAQYAESLLLPFGCTLERLYEIFQKIKHRERYNVSILPGIRTNQTSF